jgi:hypothetical protein
LNATDAERKTFDSMIEPMRMGLGGVLNQLDQLLAEA